MTESIQTTLYPLGFISSLFFGARFLLQWLHSEREGCSFVPKIFWQLSFLGNLSLGLHSAVQLQLHVLLVQAVNAVISLRNLNLMQEEKKRWALPSVLLMFPVALALSLLLFFFVYQGSSSATWFRIPMAPWSSPAAESVSFLWHIAGTVGLLLFSCRFWIQWVMAERKGESFLGKTFWWTSLAGDLLCLAYFMQINDTVNFVGPLFGLIPYLRNLMLIYRGGKAAA